MLVQWLSSYTLPFDEKSAVRTYKSMTCVACHPTEAIVATGNAMGEIMIWWNLTTTPSNLFGEVCVEGEEDDDDDSSGEGDADVEHFHAINKNRNSGWRLLHPKHVRRSGMHWHNFNVTALAFTSEGECCIGKILLCIRFWWVDASAYPLRETPLQWRC